MVPYLNGMKNKCFLNCFTLANGMIKGSILSGFKIVNIAIFSKIVMQRVSEPYLDES